MVIKNPRFKPGVFVNQVDNGVHFSYTTYVPLLAGVIHNARVTSGIFIFLRWPPVGVASLLGNPKPRLRVKWGENNIWICPAQNVGKRGKQKMIGGIIFGFALHKFPDGNFARARPRGVRLSAYGFKLTQRCGLQIPTQHQAVGVAPLSRKPKTPLARGFRFLRRGRKICPA